MGDDPDIPAALRAFVDGFVPDAQIDPLGGWSSRNLRLRTGDSDLVMRIHDPSVSRARLVAQQQLRAELAGRGLLAPIALTVKGSSIHAYENSLVEIEPYIEHRTIASTPSNFPWLFEVMGRLHAELTSVKMPMPRPLHLAWVSVATLRRWIERSISAAQGDAEALSVALDAQRLIRRVEGAWTPLPRQLVHGDIKTENFGRTTAGRTVHFDFGAAALRPRIHDLAFTIVHSVTAHVDTQPIDVQLQQWATASKLVRRYEAASKESLSESERRALAPYAAAVRLFHAAVAHKHPDAKDILIGQRSALQTIRWVLDHPRTLTE